MDAAGLSPELKTAKAHVAELQCVKTMTVWWYKVLMDEVRQCHGEEVNVWKESSRKIADSLTNDVKVAKADSPRCPWNET